MMADGYGRVVGGDEATLSASWAAWQAQPVDQELIENQAATAADGDRQVTIGKAVSVSGPGTFLGKAERTLTFAPSDRDGWFIERTDLRQLPIRVAISDVWTAGGGGGVSAVVLRSGSPHNYLRMVEHIIALKLGLGIDSLTVRVDSGDPPLFDRGSMDLVEAIDSAGYVTTDRPATHVGVKEPVTMGGPYGSFVTLLPPKDGSRQLVVDCAIDFPTAIGKQRIRFVVNRDTFRKGAIARTNSPRSKLLFVKTIGRLFADVRNLGYTKKNVLIAGPRNYVNEARLIHNGKSLEAAWHRATLDLLAALALIDKGRFCGTVISYKAGHAVDCDLVRELYLQDLLEEV
jgi:UDP-3-O-acyl-N-acetylglucosamine deacetylase